MSQINRTPQTAITWQPRKTPDFCLYDDRDIDVQPQETLSMNASNYPGGLYDEPANWNMGGRPAMPKTTLLAGLEVLPQKEFSNKFSGREGVLRANEFEQTHSTESHWKPREASGLCIYDDPSVSGHEVNKAASAPNDFLFAGGTDPDHHDINAGLSWAVSRELRTIGGLVSVNRQNGFASPVFQSNSGLLLEGIYD